VKPRTRLLWAHGKQRLVARRKSDYMHDMRAKVDGELATSM
jgi:hypothetical protein